jgi:hypothetical protein
VCEAAELLTTALHPARRTGNPGLLATEHGSVSYFYSFVGRLGDALDAAYAALELNAAGSEFFESPSDVAQQFRAFVLAALGSTGGTGG